MTALQGTLQTKKSVRFELAEKKLGQKLAGTQPGMR